MSNKDSKYQLTEDQLRFFQENGYLVIKQLITESSVQSYKQRFSDLCNGKISRSQMLIVKDYALSNDGIKPEHFINKIQELLNDEVYSTYSEDSRLLHIVSQLIGEDITVVHCMMINKPPGTNQHPPHQDMIYLPIGPANKIVVTWTAVDQVGRENGCLYMVPGTHTYHALEHTELTGEGKSFYQGIVNWEVIAPEERRVYLEMNPGDTVIFYPSIVHGSLPNSSNGCRKAITCHYASSSCNYIEVAGTVLEPNAKKMEAKLRALGSDLNYTEMWRLKTKQVRGVRYNL